MKLLILGAAGGTGRAVLAQAVVAGGILKPGPWQDAAAGHDTLSSCLGGRSLPASQH